MEVDSEFEAQAGASGDCARDGDEAKARKRTRTSDYTVHTSFGKYINDIQIFRELLSNAFDDHVMRKIPQNDVRVEPKSDRILIWNKGSAIARNNFQLGESKKLDFSISVGVFESVVGCFGRGMASAISNLLHQDVPLVYETNDNAFVFVSRLEGVEIFNRRCHEVLQLIGFQFDALFEQVLEIEDDFVPTTSAGASSSAQDSASPRHKVSYMDVSRTHGTSIFSGTKLWILLPDTQKKQRLLTALEIASKGFVCTLNKGGPLLQISYARSKLPAVEVYSQLLVPKELFDWGLNSKVVPSSRSYVFINGMAYFVREGNFLYSLNFIVSPTETKKELKSVKSVRQHLNDKRSILELSPLKDVLLSLGNAGSDFGVFVPDLECIGELRAMQHYESLAADVRTDLERSVLSLKEKLSIDQASPLKCTAAMVDYLMSDTFFKDCEYSLDSHDDTLNLRQLFHHFRSLASSIRKIEHDSSLTMRKKHIIDIARLAEPTINESSESDYEDEEDDMDTLETEDARSKSSDEVHVIDERKRSISIVRPPSPVRAIAHALIPEKYLRKLTTPVMATSASQAQQVAWKNIEKVISMSEKAPTLPPKPEFTVYQHGHYLTNELSCKALLESLQKIFEDSIYFKFEKSGASDVWSSEYFTKNAAPCSVIDCLSQQGRGECLVRSIKEAFSESSSGQNVVARRYLSYCLCRVLQIAGHGSVDVFLIPGADLASPRCTLSGNVCSLAVPFRTATDDKNRINVVFDKVDLKACFESLAHITFATSKIPELPGQGFDVLSNMLVSAMEYKIFEKHENLPLSVSWNDTRERESIHIVVLTTGYGRQHGGVTVFNMKVCESLSRCHIEQKPVFVTCVAAERVDCEMDAKETGGRLRVLHSTDLFKVLNEDDFAHIKASNLNEIYEKLRYCRLLSVDYNFLQSNANGWPAHVDIVVGHDRFTGKHAIECSLRLRSKSMVIVHTVPLWISATKPAGYDVAKKDSELKAILKASTSVVFCGNTDQLTTHTLTQLKMTFNPGYIPATTTPSLLWNGAVNGVYRLAIVGRLDDELKNVAGFNAIMTALLKADDTGSIVPFSAIEFGVNPELTELTTAGIQHVRMPNQQIFQKFSQSEDDLMRTLSGCMCLLMPSLVESFGLAAAEAAGIGLPFIVSERTGLARYLQYLKNDFASRDKWTDWSPTMEIEFAGLVDKLVAPAVAGNSFPVDEWVQRIRWIQQRCCGTTNEMIGKMALLKRVWGSWDESVKDQLLPLMTKIIEETNQATSRSN